MRFCDTSCRRAYYEELRAQAQPCQYCGKVITRRGRGVKKYCDRACYTAAQRGEVRPQYRPSKAEQRVIDAWACGVRGVRPLSRESGASVNTVRKLIADGKLVEPARTA